VQFEPLFHLPISDLWSDQYSLSGYRKPGNFGWKLPLFHSHSRNISWIANLKAGDDRATRTAQSTFWSYPDTISTEILNWSESCRNRKYETTVQVHPGQKTMGFCPVWVITPPRPGRCSFWLGLEPDWTILPVQTQTAARFSGPIADTTQYKQAFLRYV